MDEIRVWGDKEEMAKDLAKEEAQEKAEMEAAEQNIKKCSEYIDKVYEVLFGNDNPNEPTYIKIVKQGTMLSKNFNKFSEMLDNIDCDEPKLQKIYEYYKEANKNLEKLMEDIK